MYVCRGYGGIVTFPQAVGKPCPSIDPITGLVRTDEIDPNCRPPQPDKKKEPDTKKCESEQKQPAPKHTRPWWWWIITNPIFIE
jgi:hypothetical protein